MKAIVICIFLVYSNFGYGQAIIKFDSTAYTIHNVRQGTPTEKKIHFRNIGNAPLIITNVRTDIPAADWSKMPISPGEDGYITIYFPACCIGKSTNNICVFTNINDSMNLVIMSYEVVANDKERLIFGNVSDSTGQPLPFVAVGRLGSKLGTQTDLNGGYSILAKPTDTLIFEAAGFFIQKAKASGEKLDVVLFSRPLIMEDYGPPILRTKSPSAPTHRLTKKELRAVNKSGKQQ